MSNFMKKSKKVIVTILLAMILSTVGPIIVLAAEETNVPVVTAQQSAGEIKAGSELKFTITDDTKISYIFYAWNRRIDGNKTTIITLEDEPKQYEFKTTAPTEPGLYEFSIAAQDYYGNISYWSNIPYVVVDNPSGVVDTTKPVFVFNTPDEYPYNNSTIAQEMPITLRVQDDSGVYYMAYKWTRELNQSDYATGATVVYNKSEIQIKAPTEPGVWYLQMYARDGANNISEGYYTKVTVQDMIEPTLTLNGPSEVDVPLNGTYDDPGATFNDNYDAQKIVYANETLDTSKVGPQVLTYTATDAAGNESNTVSRTVTVVGTEKTYELTAPTKTEYKVNDPIDLTGANIKVIDERGNISYVTPTEDMFVDFSTTTPNTKQIFFTYNGTNIIYEYHVSDFISDILVTQPTKVEYQYQEDFNVEGGYVQKVMASGVNTVQEKMTIDMLSGYDKEKLGEQIITVSYAGKQKTFKVTVKDLTKPVISINGADPQIIQKGQVYTELGATVTDNYDKNLTAVIDATQVDINNVGIYDVTYNVADSSGNIADTITRKVHVIDYAQLQEKIDYITTLVSSDYTVDSWESLQNIMTESNNMISANQSIQTEIDEQVEKIENAISSLNAITVNQDDLDEYISSFISTDYANWSDFEILVSEARNATDLQSKFDEKLEQVKAFNLVEKEIDTTKLDIIETELATLESTDYTETSWSLIQDKIAQAKEQTLQSKFDEIVNTINLEDLVKLPKISNIIVSTSNENDSYAKVGDNIVITFDTNVELDTTQSITKVNGKQVSLQKINEIKYQFEYTFTEEDVEGLISYTIEPKGVLENVGTTIEENSSIQFDKTAPSITFAEGISDIDININDSYEINNSDVVVNDNYTMAENISIETNKEILKLNELGDYVITYTAIDEAGNESETITRTIHVKDYVTDIEITVPTKTNYIYKDELDLTGATVKKIMASATEVAAESMTTDMISGYNPEVIGEQTITVSYAEKTKEFKVNVDRATYDMSEIRFENKTVTYDGNIQTITVDGTLPEGVTVNYVGNENKNVGEYTITAKFTVDTEHYEEIPDMVATLKIEKAKVTVTIDDKTSVYGEDIVELTSQVTEGTVVEGDDLGVNLTKLEGNNVGEYDITGTASNTNYNVTFVNGTYTITEREVTITIDDKTSVYGEDIVELTSQVTEGNIVNNDELGIDLTKAEGNNVGEYEITGTASNTNYNVTFVNGTYTITEREVTITIDNKTSVYGEDIVELTSQVTEGNIVNNDDLGIDLTKAEGTNVGEYEITGTASNTNYNVTFVNGTYTITQREITITIDDKTTVYGEEIVELTSQVTEGNIVNNDELGIDLTKAEGNNVGEYEITGTANNTNYNVTFVNGTYTITPREVTITIDDKTSVYGEDIVDLTSQVTSGSVINNDDLGINLTKAEGTNAGEYEITGTASNTNYNVTFINGTYTIQKADYDMTQISFDDKEETYDGTEKTIEITGILPEGVTVSYEDNIGTDAGTYHAIAKFETADKENYNVIANKEANLIINKAEGTKNPDYKLPSLESIVYHKDRTLKDIMLPDGWLWVDETIVPEVGTMNYQANYTSTNKNYEDVSNVAISLTVLQPADQTQLNQYLEEIGYNDLIETDYTNWDEFETLVENAKSATVQDNLDILLNRIKEYTLQAKPVDQTKLDEYEQSLEGIVGTDYTNWNELQTKIAETRATTDLQSNFDSKMQEVTSLKMNIKPVDQTALKELNIQLGMKNQEDYSAQSWQAVETKIQQAKAQMLQSKFDEIIASIDLDRDLLPKELQNINISVLPKVNYEYGDELEVTGGKIQLIYDNGSSEEIDMIASEITGYNANQLGEQVLTVTHLGKTAIYRINVVNAIQGIKITAPDKIQYRYGEELDLTGFVVKEVLKNNDENILNDNQYFISGYEAEKLGEQTITVTYQEYSQNFIVTVTDYTQSIRIKEEPKTTYKKGQEFDTTGMIVEKVTAAGQIEIIDLAAITMTGYDANTVGTQNITVTYVEGVETFDTTFNVIVAEGAKPVIALKGDAVINVEVNTVYEELGATAYNADEEREVEVTIGGDVVDTSKKGIYTVTYTAEGTEPITRTVNVVDTTKPEITLSEENIYELSLNEAKPEYKATANDNYDGPITVDITDTINMDIPGNYKVIFTAKDSENNTTVIEKTVTVKDTTKPVITITGENPQIVEVNTEYKATDVIVTDNSGETIPLNINKNNLNMNRLGTYTVIYSAKDSSGNETTVERKVEVVDTTKPVIHANETEISFVNGKGSFDYENAVNVTDNYDTTIKATYTGTVNANKIGTYRVTYSAIDTSGNQADDVVITIKVTDYAPVISYYNDDNLKVEMTDGQVFCKHLSIMYNKGTAMIKEQNDTSFETYNGEVLTDGIYTIKVTAEDGTSSQKTFIIDTLAPVVTGVKAGRYTTAQTIVFEDIDDVAVATLTKYSNGEVIDLKAEGKNSYVVDESDTYTLRVEDKYGNAIMPIVFRITLP